nr:putative ribonuclease H-like domain-containing protein [Tanacetum cinerariifolium]
MRTRSSSNFPVESPPNPSSSNLKRRNRRRSKKPFILKESLVDTIADQRTMAELLLAPTEGYAEAIMVIINGDSPAPTVVIDGVVKPVTILYAEQKLIRRNELRARGTLLMALPDKHPLKFNSHKDAKTLMEAIEKRFRVNTKTKKVQKTLLKQQFENFTGSSSENLDQIHDKLQKLVSQLEIHGVSLSQEDADLEEHSLDDLFNSLRIYEAEVKHSSPIGNLTQNSAFVSSSNTDSTTDSVSAASSVCAICAQLSVSSHPNINSLSNAIIFSFFTSQSTSPQIDNEDLKQIDKTGRNLGDNRVTTLGFDMSTVECYNCHRMGHFARECRPPKDTKRSVAAEPQRRHVPVETSTSNVIVSQCDGIGSYDWSYQAAEEPANFALMAITSSSSSSDNENDSESLSPSCPSNRLRPSGGYNDVPLPITRNFMPPKPDLVFHTAPIVVETDHLAFTVQLSPTKYAQDISHTTRPMVPIIEDWVSDSKDEYKPNDPQSAPSFVQTYEHVKPSRHFVQPIHAPILAGTPKPASPKSNCSSKRKNRKTYFVCRSVDHLIKDCNFHAKPKTPPTPRNYAHMGYNKQHVSFTKNHPQKHIVLDAVLTKSKPVSVTAARPTSNSSPKVTAAKAQVVSAAKGKKGKWVFFLATKDETSPILKTFITGLENQLSLKVKVIRSDNKTEFKNSNLNQFCELEGIKREFSVPRTPQQNGIAARKNKTLIEAARTMLAYLLLPILFWAKAVNTACYVQNREHDAEKPESAVNLSPSSSALSGEQDNMIKKKDKVKSPVKYFTENRGFNVDFKDYSEDSSNNVSAAGPIVLIAGQNYSNNTNPSSVEDIAYSDHGNVGAEADFNNLETSITVSPIPTTRTHKDHPVAQIIGDLSSTTQTRSMTRVIRDQGFEDPNHPDKVYKVVKAHYGLHQAPRAWYETLTNYLLENGFHRGQIDQTFFIKNQKGDILLVQIYVDDIIFGATNKDLCKSFEKLMKDKFQISSMGELIFFLGLQVKQKEDGIFISQDKYVAEILKKFGLTEGKSASTPIDTKKPLMKDPNVKRIFRYLKGKPHLGLWYPKDSPFDLVAYSDSDYAGARLDRKSTTGGCQFLGCRLISWQCKKQTVVSTSSTEAEYVAGASCCAQVLWIQNQILDYGKSDASEGFNQIIDFLNGSYIEYALTVNPTIYVSCIKQFWNIVAIKQSNDVTRLQALVDKKKVVVTEAAIRDVLHLDDAEGIDCLPNEEIFTELARIGYEKPTITVVDDVEDQSIPSPTPPTLPSQQPQDIPSTSQAQSPPLQPQSSTLFQPQGVDFHMSLLQEALDTCAALIRRLEHLEHDKVGTSQRIESSDDTIIEDVSNQGRMIDELDKDEGVVLMNEKEETEEVKDITSDAQVEGRQAKIYQIDMDHAAKLLSMKEDEPEIQEVVEVVTTAKLITKVIAAVSETVNAAPVVPTVTTAVVPTITTAPVKVVVPFTKRRRGVVIRDPKEESSAKTPTETKSKDKGKGIMVEEPKPLKKKQQVELDEAYARKLHEELTQDIDWEVAMDYVKKRPRKTHMCRDTGR